MVLARSGGNQPELKLVASTGCSAAMGTPSGRRELIGVPPKTERVLRAFARAHPEEAYSIHRILNFRLAVAREFERLVREEMETRAATQQVNLLEESSCV